VSLFKTNQQSLYSTSAKLPQVLDDSRLVIQ